MFSRTSSGIRNIDLFYTDQYLVIVEGQDDVPFWGIFFPESIDGYKLKLKPGYTGFTLLRKKNI